MHLLANVRVLAALLKERLHNPQILYLAIFEPLAIMQDELRVRLANDLLVDIRDASQQVGHSLRMASCESGFKTSFKDEELTALPSSSCTRNAVFIKDDLPAPD